MVKFIATIAGECDPLCLLSLPLKGEASLDEGDEHLLRAGYLQPGVILLDQNSLVKRVLGQWGEANHLVM